LEGSFARVLNFVKILDGLGLINEKVRASGLRTEAPDFLSIIDVPTVFVSKLSVSFFLILLGSDVFCFYAVCKFVTKRLSNNVKSVVLVG
jgi:hypothetical protein